MPTPIEIARQEAEYVNPDGKLGVREPAAFNKYAGGRDESWCAHFVSWCFAQAGYPFASYIVPSPTRANPAAGCSRVASNMKDIGRLYKPGEITPRANDLIFYKKVEDGHFVAPGILGLDFILGHIGIVEGVDGNKVVTIEGNYSNKVARVRTPMNSPNIAYYGRPLTTAEIAAVGGAGIGTLAVVGLGAYLFMRSRRR